MNKVIGFELKKIISRPGIYILAVLLAVLLTVSAFVYNPKETKKTYNTLMGKTVSEMNVDFYNNYKTSYDSIVSSTLAIANEINAKSSTEYKDEINTLLANFVADSENFADIANNVVATNEQKKSSLEKIHNTSSTGSLDVLYNTILTNLGKKDDEYFVLSITNNNYNYLVENFALIQNQIDEVLSSNIFTFIADKLISDYIPQISEKVGYLHFPNYTNEVAKFVASGNYYNITIERKNIIIREMADIYNSVTNNIELETDENLISKFNDLFNEYRLVSQTYADLFNNTINICLIESFSSNEQNSIRFKSATNLYTERENQTKLKFYVENDTTEYDYANPLTFDYASNEKANAYDYAYFALSIFSVILVAFAIMLAAHTIAGETKEGCMRFVAIRPVTRTKMLLGKFLAIAIITFIMLIFSAISAFIVGAFTFGVSSANILSIVDATNVVVLHPILSLLIFIGSQYLQILVYISIAIMFTSFIKSDLLVLIISFLIYAVNLVLPMFFGTTSWLRFNPFTNINLYAYVGSNSIVTDSTLGKLFSPAVYSDSSIWLSIILIAVMIVVFNTIAVYAFKKREL